MCKVGVMLILFCLILAKAVSAQNSSTGSQYSNVTCKSPNLNNIAYCAGLITYDIPNYINESIEDQSAESDGEPNPNSKCPFYTSTNYQCRKHFPVCVTNADNTTNIIKICATSCSDGGQLWNGDFCRNFGSAYFATECGSTYYSDASPPQCYDYPYSDSSAATTWKIILVAILCSVGGVLLLSFAWNRFKYYRNKKTLEKEDEEDNLRNIVLHAEIEARHDSVINTNAGASVSVGGGQRNSAQFGNPAQLQLRTSVSGGAVQGPQGARAAYQDDDTALELAKQISLAEHQASQQKSATVQGFS